MHVTQSSGTLNLFPDQAERSVVDLRATDLNVVFQPIVNLRAGKTFAVEALCRCTWPEFASPPVLFEHAVTEACTGQLGRFIRDVAFDRVQETPLFVNLHPHELSQHWLVRPDDPLFFHGHDVYLEITESAAFSYYDLCVNVLKEVCSRSGAHLVIDDFGAGYSNLKRIVDLEPQIVKLDLAFTRDLDRLPRQRVLVEHVVRLCEELGAKVVAEGIETIDELKATIDCGVHYGQGYLLARPSFPVPDPVWPLA